jgi:hypothetical protein
LCVGDGLVEVVAGADDVPVDGCAVEVALADATAVADAVGGGWWWRLGDGEGVEAGEPEPEPGVGVPSPLVEPAGDPLSLDDPLPLVKMATTPIAATRTQSAPIARNMVDELVGVVLLTEVLSRCAAGR